MIPNPIMRSKSSMEFEGPHNKYHALYRRKGEGRLANTKFKAHGKRIGKSVCLDLNGGYVG